MVVGLAFLVGLGIFLANQAEPDAQACRIVRIYGVTEADTSEILLEPETLWVDRKTCVIWTNWVGGKVVSVRFSEGKKCEATTTGTKLFKLDDANCYISSFIEYGGTTSLTFKDVGTYEYVVDSKDMKSVKGKVVVR
jgi:hypothetical protein